MSIWFVKDDKNNDILYLLIGLNHPVRLRFATARHPSTLEGIFITTTPSCFAVHPFASEGDFGASHAASEGEFNAF
ncbi:MAG: hypothetical protein LBB23_02670 [Rickettsiales bacterium]|nr:hypothetical protein [Rickettsiales bacterium]